MREAGFESSPIRGGYALFKIGRENVGKFIDESLPHIQGADLVVGGGAQIVARTLADSLGVPYAFIAYTPQALRSSHHAPAPMAVGGMPKILNRFLWRAFIFVARLVFAGPLNRKRRSLGLAPVRDFYDHFFPRDASLVAADPELAPLPPDVHPAFTPSGALHLPDEPPLPSNVERFLARAPAPIYLGFGSMLDTDAKKTTACVVAAARAAGVRLILSSGWARLGEQVSGDDILVVGDLSHTLLFSHVAAVVHHGGAGTTSAAMRAGRPQLVVPHVFDQFQWAKWAHAAGLGPKPIPKNRLTVERLRDALQMLVNNEAYAVRATALAKTVRARDATKECIADLATLAGRH